MANQLALALAGEGATLQIVDLTHTISENTCVWDGSCGFESELTGDYSNGGFRGQRFTMRSCLGTHIDSPAHCYEGAADCSTIPLENCVVPACVIDVTLQAGEDYGISVDDIQAFEDLYGEILPGALVFFSTGWSKKWNDPVSFRSEKNDGTTHFPFVTPEAAELLLKRKIVGIGIDTISPDPLNASAPVHKLLLGAGKYIIENVAHLENMPPVNAYAVVLPLKISGAVESPIRLIGLVAK